MSQQGDEATIQPMRLLICTPTASLHGGVERILEALAGGLPSRGFDVRFALAKGARFHDPDRFRREYPNVRGVDVDGSSGTAFGRRRALRRVVESVDPDVVLIARMFDAYPVCSELKANGHRLRLAVTIQAYEEDYFIDLARWAPFVDVVIASGERIAARARAIVPHVVSIPGGVAFPRRERVAAETLRLGYAGRLEQVQKRILDLPRLAGELRERGVPFALEVAGEGTLAAELRKRLPEARYHGWLSADALYERFYPELDVFVHFAEWEGLTIAPREAMVHGVVPVVSRFEGAEDFIDGMNALRFPVGDVRAAADAIERLHRDRELLERLSRNARESQQGIRSHEGALDAWADAFRAAAARRGRIGATLPDAPRDSGLLTRLGVPDAVAEVLRRVRRRRHAGPGDEWPHWSGER